MSETLRSCGGPFLDGWAMGANEVIAEAERLSWWDEWRVVFMLASARDAGYSLGYHDGSNGRVFGEALDGPQS